MSTAALSSSNGRSSPAINVTSQKDKMFTFISNLFKKKPDKSPVVTAEHLDRNRIYGPPYGYVIDENLELWRGRSHPDENMHWSKLAGMNNDGSPCWVLSRTDCPVSHKMHDGVGAIFAAEGSEMQKVLLSIFGKRIGNTYPNPLNVDLGFGRIKLSLFHAGGSHGILLEETGETNNVGELFYQEDEGIGPQPGHIYLTCHNIESAMALRAMVNRVVCSFPNCMETPESPLMDGDFQPFWLGSSYGDDPFGCVELVASKNSDVKGDPVFTHFAAEVAQQIAGDNFDITSGRWGARIVYATNARNSKESIHKMADTIVAHKAWIGLCGALSVFDGK